MSATDALPFAPEAAPGKLVSAVLAVAVHLMLLAFLFYGIRWQNQKPEAIEVELVQAAPPIVEPAAPQVEQPPPPQPVVEPEPAPPPPKPEIALKEKEKPKSPQKPATKPPSNLFQKQAEQEWKQTVERNQIEATNAAIAQELSKVRDVQAANARNKARIEYMWKISSKIKPNIVLPLDLKGNPETVFDVVQLPSGEILSAKLKKSSGHAGYDTAVERAILKASPLPKPEASDLFSRELELKFRPLEE